MAGMRTDMHHEDHLRRLLDQRTARADLHERFPSTSEFSDSPSVYSHAHFSPRSFDRVELEASTSSLNYHPMQMPLEMRSDRQRLNMPEASSLDLDDDPQPSYSSPVFSVDDDLISEESPDDTSTEAHRVTYGPKMTVHSRAPWETDEDEQNSSVKKAGLIFNRKDNSKKVRGRDAHSPAADSRPSVDSVRPQPRGKQSFDTTSSTISAGGALLTLAGQASMSATSLPLSSSPQTSLRNKLSIPRFRSRTPSNNKDVKPDQNEHRPYQSSLYAQSVPRLRSTSPMEQDFSSGDSRLSSNPPSPVQQQEYHPYANPDLIRGYTQDPRRVEYGLARAQSNSPPLPASDTINTISESNTITSLSTVSQSRSNATAMTPDTSTFSMKMQPDSRGYAKGISPPVSGHARGMESYMSNDANSSGNSRDLGVSVASLAGWQESSGSTTPIKLISLEEAQAQARERSRSGGLAANSSANAGSSRTIDSTQSAWTRMRSSSTGGSKMKNMASSSVADFNNVPPLPSEMSSSSAGGSGRTVVRKRSGFMRLFNGKDKGLTTPPPMPSPPHVPSMSMEPLPSSPRPSPLPTPKRKQTTPRVRVPSITPSIIAEHTGFDYLQSDEELNSNLAPPPSRERQLSARRNVPGLSIVTTPSSASPTSAGARSPLLREPHTAPLPGMARGGFLQSNQATSFNTSPELTNLDIRRMSAMLGAVFSDQLNINPGSASPHPALSSDNDTPTTNSTSVSPCSPSVPFKLEGDVAQGKDDQSSVIQALQEQITTARRAWQQQIWELEGQVRDLKAEVDDLRTAEKHSEHCTACGRGGAGKPMLEEAACIEDLRKVGVKVGGVVNRPRARTGVGTRFGSAT